MTSVATAGVFSVWSLREFSMAEVRDRNGGIQRRAPGRLTLLAMP